MLFGHYEGTDSVSQWEYASLDVDDQMISWREEGSKQKLCKTGYSVVFSGVTTDYPSRLLGASQKKYWSAIVKLSPKECVGDSIYMQFSFSQDSEGTVSFVGYGRDAQPGEWLTLEKIKFENVIFK